MPLIRGGLPQPIPVAEKSSDPGVAANKALLYAKQMGAADAVLHSQSGAGIVPLGLLGGLGAVASINAPGDQINVNFVDSVPTAPGNTVLEVALWAKATAAPGADIDVTLGLSEISTGDREAVEVTELGDGSRSVLHTAAGMRLVRWLTSFPLRFHCFLRIFFAGHAPGTDNYGLFGEFVGFWRTLNAATTRVVRTYLRARYVEQSPPITQIAISSGTGGFWDSNFAPRVVARRHSW